MRVSRIVVAALQVAACAPAPDPGATQAGVTRAREIGETQQALTPQLTWGGGPVMSSVRVVPVFWGNGVTNTATLNSFYASITNSGYLDWLTEYDTTIGTISRGTSVAGITDTTPPSGSLLTDAQVQTELARLINNGTLPAPTANTLYMVHLPPNVGVGEVCACDSNSLCGYHSFFNNAGANVFYAIIGDMTWGGCDSTAKTCHRYCGSNTSTPPLSDETAVASHELTEAITDPQVSSSPAWQAGGVQGEIGDLCNLQQVQFDGFTVQLEWSNAFNACIADGTATQNYQQLMFYDAPASAGGFETLDSWTDQSNGTGYPWNSTWTHIIPGFFGGPSGNTDLLFYDSNTGSAAFYTVSPQGNFSYLSTPQPYSAGWTHIIPGKFWTGGQTGLFFYNRSTGAGGICGVTSSQGLVCANTNYRFSTWDIIVPGQFGGNDGVNGCSDLLYYNTTSGAMAFQVTDCAGHVTDLTSNPRGTAPGFTNIVSGDFGGDGWWEMIAYDRNAGSAVVWQNNGGTSFSVLKSYTDWGKNWSIMLSGEFGANDLGANGYADRHYTDLLLYDGAHTAAFFTSDGFGNLAQLRTYTDWSTWTMLGVLKGPTLMH